MTRACRFAPSHVLLALVSFLIVTCSGLSTPVDPYIVSKPANEIVLALEDLPPGFRIRLDREVTLDERASEMVDPVGAKRAREAIGWLSSWRREFVRTSTSTSGVTAVFASAVLYKDSAGADVGMEANLTRSERDVQGQRRVNGAGLGDASAVFVLERKSGSFDLVAYTILFRFANVSNSLIVQGLKGTFDLPRAIEIAAAQLARQKPSVTPPPRVP